MAIPRLLLTLELAIIAVLHLFVFPSAPYSSSSSILNFLTDGEVSHSALPTQGGFLGLKAILDALNF
jgi:hypothetical protein